MNRSTIVKGNKSKAIQVLLVEDNPGDARLIREMLTETGPAFDLTWAQSFKSAVEILSEKRIDVVLTDLTLPDSRGLDTLRNILLQVPGMPVVILSGHDDESRAIKAVKEGAQDYLIKGQVTSQLLSRTIQYAIERKIIGMQLLHAQKMESVGHLAAGMAHEINTPIQYISTNTRFIRDSFLQMTALFANYVELVEEARKIPRISHLAESVASAMDEVDMQYLLNEIPTAIQHSLEGLNRVSDIVQAIYAFSHLGTRGKQNIDINKAISTTMTVASNELKKVAEIEANFCENLPLVQVTPHEFNQVILHILLNAAQAIGTVIKKDSGEKGVITASTNRQGEWIEVRVADTGPGIPRSIRDKIFNPFFTTRKIGDGMGQGLAYCHNVITRHGGTIGFETDEGVGTTFIIRLPLKSEGNNRDLLHAEERDTAYARERVQSISQGV